MRTVAFPLAVFLTSLLAASGATAAPKKPCPDNAGGYVAGEDTAKFVKSCLGRPTRDDYNGPDGMFNYMYELKDGTMIFFVFEKSGVLVRVRGYTTDGGGT
jgi:hypothetical protein